MALLQLLLKEKVRDGMVDLVFERVVRCICFQLFHIQSAELVVQTAHIKDGINYCKRLSAEPCSLVILDGIHKMLCLRDSSVSIRRR